MSVFPGFAQAIADAARSTWQALRAAHPDEHFYAFALYTDSGAMTVVPAANSQEGLKRAFERMGAGDEDKPWVTWSSAEWAYEAAEADGFDPLCDRLREVVIGPHIPEAEFGEFFRALQLDMIEALRLLDREGVFGAGVEREKLTLFVTISDDNGAEALENESAKLLNPAAVFERFIERY